MNQNQPDPSGDLSPHDLHLVGQVLEDWANINKVMMNVSNEQVLSWIRILSRVFKESASQHPYANKKVIAIFLNDVHKVEYVHGLTKEQTYEVIEEEDEDENPSKDLSIIMSDGLFRDYEYRGSDAEDTCFYIYDESATPVSMRLTR